MVEAYDTNAILGYPFEPVLVQYRANPKYRLLVENTNNNACVVTKFDTVRLSLDRKEKVGKKSNQLYKDGNLSAKCDLLLSTNQKAFAYAYLFVRFLCKK